MLGEFFHAAGYRPADHRRQPPVPAASQDRQQILLMHQHAAQHSYVGPFQVGIGKRAYVGIHQPLVPMLRQQRGDGEQTQWWVGRALAFKWQRVLETPVGIRPLGIDEESVHVSQNQPSGFESRPILDPGMMVSQLKTGETSKGMGLVLRGPRMATRIRFGSSASSVALPTACEWVSESCVWAGTSAKSRPGSNDSQKESTPDR